MKKIFWGFFLLIIVILAVSCEQKKSLPEKQILTGEELFGDLKPEQAKEVEWRPYQEAPRYQLYLHPTFRGTILLLDTKEGRVWHMYEDVKTKKLFFKQIDIEPSPNLSN